MDEDKSSRKILIVFDLDQTILAEFSDIHILKLLPEESQNIFRSQVLVARNWADFMQDVYVELMKENVSVNQIRESVEEIAFNPGFEKLFQFLKANQEKFETLIISGANTLYLEWILEKHELQDLFPRYYSNPAFIDTNGGMKIRAYHVHNCSLCEQSQCKKIILQDFFKDNSINIEDKYSRLIYVGDGENDYCPGTLLREGDILFARAEFKLYRLLFSQGLADNLQCIINVWKDGFDIIEKLKKII